MVISQELILEIRQKANIVDIISEYISIEQKGKNYFAICPFHDDHNPSMSISPEKQIYTCFVCGAHGNVFSFVMDYENISFVEAVKTVGEKVGIKVDNINYKRKEINNELERFYEIYDISNKLYQNNLKTKDGIDAKEYLKVRNFTDDIIKEFKIGLSINNNLYSLLNKKGFSDEDLVKIGICSSNEGRIYDTFINRIMFPLFDLEGRIVGFSGRIYNNDDSAKYINSKESIIFKKGKLLYNYHKAKNEIRRKKKVIIVEGFMDVIALHKVNIKNVIATMGTAVTNEQAELIKRLSNNVIICFDGDYAGNNATLSFSSELLKIGVVPKIVRLPKGLDPDDFLNKFGVDKFNDLIDNPKSLLNYKIEHYRSNINFENADEISGYIKNVIKELKNEKDKIIREVTLKNLSDETNVSITTLNNLYKQEQSNINVKKTTQKKHVTLNKYEKAERRLIFYMLRHVEVLKIFNKNKCFFPTQKFRFLCNEMLYFYEKYGNINIADFISYLDGKVELKEALCLINSMEINEQYSHEEIMDYIKLLNNYNVEIEIKRLTQLFKSEVDEIKKAELAKQISDLKVRV